MTTPASKKSRKLVWAAVAALFVLHHDFWLWDSRTLVFGFIPVGLFYHGVFSLAAGGVWALANKYAWPTEIEEWADEAGHSDENTTGGAR